MVSGTLDRVLAPADHELTHWRELRDVAVAHEYLALDHLVASALWAHRTARIPARRRPTSWSTPSTPISACARPSTSTPPVSSRLDAVALGPGRRRVPARQVAGDQFLAETRE